MFLVVIIGINATVSTFFNASVSSSDDTDSSLSSLLSLPSRSFLRHISTSELGSAGLVYRTR